MAAVGSRAPLGVAPGWRSRNRRPSASTTCSAQPPAGVAPGVLAGAVLAVAALAAVAVCHVVLPGHPGVPAWLLPALAAPALLACRPAHRTVARQVTRRYCRVDAPSTDTVTR